MSEKKLLQVEVEQTPGTIHWNFDELKAGLAEKMQDYKGLVYTEDTVKEAQKDVADLRKLKKSVEDRRKEIKKKCMEPYDVIEAQAKELIALIDEPINEIDKQVKEYEEERKRKKKAEIIEYMGKAFEGIDEAIIKKLEFKVYDDRWENKTCSNAAWKNAIDEAVQMTKNDIAVISQLEDEFVEPCMKEYRKNLVLNEAMAKAQELRRQKEMIIERERQRQEAIRKQKEEEERRQAEEKIRAEERARAEQQAREQAALQPQLSQEEPQEVEEVHVEKNVGETYQGTTEPVYGQTDDVVVDMEEKIAEESMEPDEHWILFKGDMEKYNKVLAFIKYVGAEVVEVRECS